MNIIDENRHYIERALAYSGGTHSFEDVKSAILEGTMQLWPYQGGAGVTEIIEHPQKKVLNVFLAAGNLDVITSAIDSVADWGRHQGCQSMTLHGRSGWLKVLRERGFNQTLITMERVL